MYCLSIQCDAQGKTSPSATEELAFVPLLEPAFDSLSSVFFAFDDFVGLLL